MILRIDSASAVPVYAQIVEQVKRAIASGTIKTGEALPSLRETAMKLRVNPLTVGKAYKHLEMEGLIETRHGLGSFVTASAVEAVSEFRKDVLGQAIDSVLVDAYHLGVGFDEVREILDERIAAAEDGFAQPRNEEVNQDDK